jgi:hypothetical protein
MRYVGRWRCVQCSKLHAPAKFPVNRENNRENHQELLLFVLQSPVFIEQS